MVLSVFLEFVTNLEKTPERAVLERIASLYGASILERHIALFYEVKIDLIEDRQYLKREPKTVQFREICQNLRLKWAKHIFNALSFFFCSKKGGFITSPRPIELLKAGIIELLPVLKDDAIPLIDTIAPNDFVLNSPLGMSDGQVYKHLQSILWQTSSTFERPKWWQLVTHWKTDGEKAKL